MAERKEIVCIVCPVGCRLFVELEDKAIAGVSGNLCGRGPRYAEGEILNPTRIVTGSAFVAGGHMSLVSMRTREAVPKGSIPLVLDEIRKLKPAAPIPIGAVLLADVAGTGVDVIATRTIRAKT